MAKLNKTKKDIIYMMLYQLLTILVPLVITPYISRIFGAEGIGIYSYTYSVVSYFALFASLSYYEFGNRMIAQVRADKAARSRRFANLYTLQVATAGLALIAYGIYLLFIIRENKLLAVIQGLYLFSALFDVNWFFFGMEEFKLTVIRNTVIKLSMLACIFLFVRSADDLAVYILIMAAGTMLSNLVMWLFLRGRVDYVKPQLPEIRKIVIPALILFLPLVARSIFVYMDKILLKKLCDYSQVGFYENAERIILGPTSLVTALGSVMLSKLSGLSARKRSSGDGSASMDAMDKHVPDTDLSEGQKAETVSDKDLSEGQKAETVPDKDLKEGYRLIRGSMEFVFLLSSAFVFGLSAVAITFSEWYYGKGFEECAVLIRMMSLTMFPVAWCNVLRTQYLIPNGKDKVYAGSVIAGAITNFMIDILLIPTLGARGAVIGWLAAELVIAVWQTAAVGHKLPIRRYLMDGFPYVLAGFVMYFCVSWLTKHIFTGTGQAGLFPVNGGLLLLSQIIIGAVIYLVMAGFIYLMHSRLGKNKAV